MVRVAGWMLSGLIAAGAAPPAAAAPASWPVKPPVAETRPVTEDYFGTALTDDYRYMETPGDPVTARWIAAQADYSRSILDAIPARAAYLSTVSALGDRYGIVLDYREAGGRAFWRERPAGAQVFDLMTRDASGRVTKLVDIAALDRTSGTANSINYFEPSPDGRRVAVGISVGGNENADLTVIDAATGARLAGPIPNARYAGPQFLADGTIVLTIAQALKPGQARTETFLNRRLAAWDLKSPPRDLAGAGVGAGPAMRPEEAPYLAERPTGRTALMTVFDGVKAEAKIFAVPTDRLSRPGAQWRQIVTTEDAVTATASRGDRLFALSNRGAPTFRLIELPLSGTMADARERIPADPGRVLEGVEAARDATYVYGLRGVYGVLLRLPADGSPAQEVPLPMKGTIVSVDADPERDGAVVQLAGWATPPTLYRYDPAARRFAQLPSGDRPAGVEGRYVVRDLSARAKDGVAVPLTLVAGPGAPSPRPLLLTAYGSYGVSSLPSFSPARMAMIDEGAASATCHVRGGGELGEAWRLAGKDDRKPNTWRDLIACAEHLIAAGWTRRDLLVISGTSAGGIAVGRAMIERPDLFAGVISNVPMASAIRAEYQQNGPVNTIEFGTVKDPIGFRNLYAMDAYYTVEPGKAYPAVMFTTGLNDTRVDTWQPAKAAARMQAAGSPNPVLLRVETAGGHGGGTTRAQADALAADSASFLFWRAGRAGWQPVPPGR